MNELFKPPVLGIDLGASFTKVAYRPGWRSKTRYEEPCRIVMIEGKPLVPSLVIHTKGKRQAWLCGQTAAAYQATSTDRVFTNWKADIFSEALTAQIGGSLKAAGQFFEWLHEKVTAAGVNVASCRVKVCLPAFPDIERPASILAQEMEFAGWKNVDVSRVSEPRANTVGVFAEGRNTLYCSDIVYGINPIYMEMYPQGSPLLNHLRSYGLSGGARHAAIALIDVGSFTTDLSVVDFDAEADGDFIASARQTSYRLGIIGAFETPLLEYLSRRHEFTLDVLTFDDREEIKKAFAMGGRYTLTVPGNRNIQLGDTADQKAATHIAVELAEQVWNAYCDTVKGTKPKFLILTGGGCAATVVKEAIHDRFRRSATRWIDAEGMEVADESPKGSRRRWPNTGEVLPRLATALGAASVILDLPVGPLAPEIPKLRKVESPWISCSCQGGNKECMRCGGLGMYKRA